MSIQFKHLKMIQALAHSETLAKAAQRLFMTQSALSHQLKDIEQKLACEIIVRKSKPLALTPSGQLILATANEVLIKLETLNSHLTKMQRGEMGRLHISIECHSCYLWLLPTLDKYRESWADIELDLLTGYSFGALPALKKGDLDLVITSDPDPISGITYIPLFAYESVLAVPNRHPLIEQGYIEAKDLSQETLICYPMARERLDIFRLFLTPAKVEPLSVRHSELTVMMMQLVASGRGVSGLPQWAANEFTQKHYVQALKLGQEGIFSTLYAAVREQDLDSKYMREFLLLAKDIPFSSLQNIYSPSSNTQS